MSSGTTEPTSEPDAKGGDGDDTDSIADRELLQHCPAINTRSRAESYNAPPRRPSFPYCQLG